MPEVHEINSLLLTASASELVQIFHHLQGQRVGTYIRFDRTFQDFLANKDFQEYEKHCTSITKIFSITSNEVREIEAVLRTQNKIIVADIIRSVQELEKEKLVLTSKLQVLKTDQTMADDEDREEAHEQQIKQTTQQLQKVIQDINAKLEELHFEMEGED